MRHIADIHTFEDKAFLRSVTVASVVVLVLGTVLGILWFCVLVPRVSWLPAAEVGFMFRGDWTLSLWAGALMAGLVVSLLVHEGVHGIFFKLFAPPGARVTFGANLGAGMLYACADGIVYSRRHYIVVLLAPTVALTVSLLVLGAVSGFPLACYAISVLHLSGCVGDWGYVLTILKNPLITHCMDTDWGVQFLGCDDGEGPLEAPAADGEGRR